MCRILPGSRISRLYFSQQDPTPTYRVQYLKKNDNNDVFLALPIKLDLRSDRDQDRPVQDYF